MRYLIHVYDLTHFVISLFLYFAMKPENICTVLVFIRITSVCNFINLKNQLDMPQKLCCTLVILSHNSRKNMMVPIRLFWISSGNLFQQGGFLFLTKGLITSRKAVLDTPSISAVFVTLVLNIGAPTVSLL